MSDITRNILALLIQGTIIFSCLLFCFLNCRKEELWEEVKRRLIK